MEERIESIMALVFRTSKDWRHTLWIWYRNGKLVRYSNHKFRRLLKKPYEPMDFRKGYEFPGEYWRIEVVMKFGAGFEGNFNDAARLLPGNLNVSKFTMTFGLPAQYTSNVIKITACHSQEEVDEQIKDFKDALTPPDPEEY